MEYRQIISAAWVFTQENKKLIKWYAFIPSLLGTIIGILYFTYQYFAFRSSVLFENWESSFLSQALRMIFDLLINDPKTAFPILIIAGVIGLIHLLLPPICQGALIQLIARRYNGQQISELEGVKYGLLSFLRLFKYQLMVRGLSLLSILAPAAAFIRSFGKGSIGITLVVFGLFSFVSLILNLLFTYAEFYIVIDSEDVVPSISKSSKLVISHWQMTFLVGILMLVIGIRIIVQILILLLVPSIVVLIASYLATVTFATTGLIVGGIIGFIALCFAAYLGGTIHVFSVAVWVFTFLQLSNEEEVPAREIAATQPLA